MRRVDTIKILSTLLVLEDILRNGEKCGKGKKGRVIKHVGATTKPNFTRRVQPENYSSPICMQNDWKESQFHARRDHIRISI
jgi:hypothetical protein